MIHLIQQHHKTNLATLQNTGTGFLKYFKGLLLPKLFLLLAIVSQPLQAQSANDEDPSLDVGAVEVDRSVYKVKVADPFIEMHTGPGSGFPIYNVVDRGEEVTILRRSTDFFQVRSGDGKTGWVHRDQMRETLLPGGEQFKVIERDLEDFRARKWILGVTAGEFEDAPVFTVFTGYSFTENMVAEFHYGQSIGDKSSSEFIKMNLVMQPWPEYKYSPYMTLGIGQIKVEPSATLIAVDDDTNEFAQFGLGVQRYLSRSFLLRLEVNEYVIFSSTSTSDNNEEVTEWKLGFAVFF